MLGLGVLEASDLGLGHPQPVEVAGLHVLELGNVEHVKDLAEGGQVLAQTGFGQQADQAVVSFNSVTAHLAVIHGC